ncbi:hypothetical protein ACFMI6_18115, partial [Acinetobacter baumannii]
HRDSAIWQPTQTINLASTSV